MNESFWINAEKMTKANLLICGSMDVHGGVLLAVRGNNFLH
jgi:hypothetical protein